MIMKAYFAGGCFWCLEHTMRDTDGVLAVMPGYCGGAEVSPVYGDVKAQKTGHRETVEVEYDPSVITFSRLVEVYLSSVDPFDTGGQFIDRGHSYTCAVYYTNDTEKDICLEKLSSLERSEGKKTAISLEEFSAFYPAEEYHRNYAEKNPELYEKEYISSGRLDYFEKKQAKK